MNYPEPFISSLVEGPAAFYGDLRKFENQDNYIVRVEQYTGNQDLLGYKSALHNFEQISGLSIIPYWDVIGESDPPEDLIGVKYSDNCRFPAVFHIAKLISSVNVSPNTSVLDFSPEVAAELIDGLTDYFISTYESGVPYSYEIRPSQFMYGKIIGDEFPKLYMVDVDYALSDNATIGDLLWNLSFNVDYLKDYFPNISLRRSANRILDYLTNNLKIKQWSQDSLSNGDELDNLKTEILDYIDAIDHLL